MDLLGEEVKMIKTHRVKFLSVVLKIFIVEVFLSLCSFLLPFFCFFEFVKKIFPGFLSLQDCYWYAEKLLTFVCSFCAVTLLKVISNL